MKLNLLATFFLISSYLYSQQTVTTSGGNIESDQVSLSYTIGQLKVNTIEKVDSSVLELDFIQGVQYAYIIDVGAESTRPFSDAISIDEEINS